MATLREAAPTLRASQTLLRTLVPTLLRRSKRSHAAGFTLRYRYRFSTRRCANANANAALPLRMIGLTLRQLLETLLRSLNADPDHNGMGQAEF